MDFMLSSRMDIKPSVLHGVIQSVHHAVVKSGCLDVWKESKMDSLTSSRIDFHMYGWLDVFLDGKTS
jgi:hypothetical protein